MKNNMAWAIIDDSGTIYIWTLAFTRKAVVEFVAENWSMTWKEIKQRGFRCVKVRLAEVK